LAGNSKTPPGVLKELVEHPEIEIKIRLSMNKNTPPEALTKLKNYSIEAIKKSKNKEDLENNIKILKGVAKHKNTSTEDLRDLLANFLNIIKSNMSQEDFENMTKKIRLNVARNLNTSLEDLEKLEKFDSDSDVREAASTTIIKQSQMRKFETAIETAISEAAIAEAVMESAGQKEGDNLKIILYDYSLLRQD